MSSTSRSVGRIASALRTPSTPRTHVCLSCRRAQSQQQPERQPRRTYASAATAQATVEAPPVTQATLSKGPSISPISQQQSTVKIHAGIVLSRPPLVTPDPHPFETAYYLYQRRLNERLVLPFTQYFYYKRGTPAFEHWRAKRRERNNVAARDIGAYNPYTPEGWNDEALVGDQTGEPEHVVKALLDDEGKEVREGLGADDGGAKLGGLRRRTQADEVNDERSLERAMTRTLYLVVKKGKISETQDLWEFPSAPIEGSEGLKEGAMRILGASCGVDMNTWFVGSHPVGHLVHSLPPHAPKSKSLNQEEVTGSSSSAAAAAAGGSTSLEKTFFMKARIMAGQADVTNNTIAAEDFKWLAKEEVQKVVTEPYWIRVKNMLVEQ